MKRFNYFYITMICALSACSVGVAQETDWLTTWYINRVRKMNRPASEISGYAGSFWSNCARPGIESIGSASRYLVPTSLSKYAQTFPTVQKFTSLPRETQNFYLGVGALAGPLAALAAYKAAQHGYKGAQNLYQWWNEPTVEQLQLQEKIESLAEKQRLCTGRMERLGSSMKWLSSSSSEYKELRTELDQELAQYSKLSEKKNKKLYRQQKTNEDTNHRECQHNSTAYSIVLAAIVHL